MSGLGGDPAALRSPFLVWFFRGVMRRQVRGGFRALRLARPGLPALPPDRPVVVYSTHPSWWDPAVYMVLAPTLMGARESYGPIDAAMLERYRFFARIGLYGTREGREGAVAFLRTSEALLASPARALWIAAQGRFADPRERPLGLRPGVAHLLARCPQAVALPLALEYPFWGERRPEALALFGEPQDGALGLSADAWGLRLEGALTDAADRLATLAVARDPAAFATLVGGTRGVGGVYGAWLRARALVGGAPYDPDHVPEEERERRRVAASHAPGEAR